MNGELKQECIPAGCVPSAAVAVCWGGGSSRGVSAQGGGGVTLLPPVNGMTDRQV